MYVRIHDAYAGSARADTHRVPCTSLKLMSTRSDRVVLDVKMADMNEHLAREYQSMTGDDKVPMGGRGGGGNCVAHGGDEHRQIWVIL